ncbi:hypothetical protein L1987_00379 [Smallanthus sonchifolius]|uniref:Uncharacterized protein n=1 Tax=Smallanthus sonchifolius TaxID=185202 RepID=A0ACB9K263_9ASTR|nr:hypothetical protein L1987_00379 [Smallanthus sonchifolius]
MAQTLPKYVLFTLFIFSTLLVAQSHQFSRKLSTKSLGFKKEKVSHFHFYFHDTVSGDHPSAVRVVDTTLTNTPETFFGGITVIDDPLTVGPEPNSKIVGRAQGIYAAASLSEISFLMTLNYVFVEGKYNGSTLSILGSNPVFSKVREMPIVGGSGLFRFARGYALAKTHSVDTTSGNAVVEYNVYVLHY